MKKGIKMRCVNDSMLNILDHIPRFRQCNFSAARQASKPVCTARQKDTGHTLCDFYKRMNVILYKCGIATTVGMWYTKIA